MHGVHVDADGRLVHLRRSWAGQPRAPAGENVYLSPSAVGGPPVQRAFVQTRLGPLLQEASAAEERRVPPWWGTLRLHP